MMRWGDDTANHDCPRWAVFLLGMVSGLILSWAQYAYWAAR